MNASKSAAKFVKDDFVLSPVWAPKPEEQLALGEDESWMCPVLSYPVDDLSGHAVGVEVALADGSRTWVAIFNTWLHQPDLNSQFQQFMFISGHQRCNWAPAGFFGNIGASGAAVVAAFLRKTDEEIFPFTYDITRYAIGRPEVLVRTVSTITDSPDEEPWEAAMRAATAAMNTQGGNER